MSLRPVPVWWIIRLVTATAVIFILNAMGNYSGVAGFFELAGWWLLTAVSIDLLHASYLYEQKRLKKNKGAS